MAGVLTTAATHSCVPNPPRVPLGRLLRFPLISPRVFFFFIFILEKCVNLDSGGDPLLPARVLLKESMHSQRTFVNRLQLSLLEGVTFRDVAWTMQTPLGRGLGRRGHR